MISTDKYSIFIGDKRLYSFSATKKYIKYANKLLENFDNPQEIYKEKPHPDIMVCINNKLYWNTTKSPANQVFNQDNYPVLDSIPECEGTIYSQVNKDDLTLYVNNLDRFQSKYFKYMYFNFTDLV